MVATCAIDESSVGISLATSPELELGGMRIVLESEDLLTTSGSSSTFVGNGRYRAVRPLGPDIDHTSTYQATYESNTQCLHLDGTATIAPPGFRSWRPMQSSTAASEHSATARLEVKAPRSSASLAAS